jgi:CheY-like chemotaxis protein
MNLLIVDDMKSFLDLEKAFLRRADCRVLTAATGLEAIRVAQAEQPDLIILDIEMPELNGIEATRILKANRATAAIPIVIFSSTTRKDEAMAAGAQEFVSKPVDEERFLDTVQRYVPLQFRKDERKTLSTGVRFSRDQEHGEGKLTDISVSGCFLVTNTPLWVGDSLRLFFSLPMPEVVKEIQAEAMVVRKAQHGFGLGFTDISEGAKLFIGEFVAG